MKTFLTPDELAKYLRLPSVQTVYQWRTKGYGPAGSKVGKRVLFDLDEVNDWVAARRAA